MFTFLAIWFSRLGFAGGALLFLGALIAPDRANGLSEGQRLVMGMNIMSNAILLLFVSLCVGLVAEISKNISKNRL